MYKRQAEERANSFKDDYAALDSGEEAEGILEVMPEGFGDVYKRQGIRCVAKYVYDHKLTDKTEISVETGAGIKYLTLYVEENKVSQVRVDMGEPILTPGDIPVVKADGSAYGCLLYTSRCV